MSGLISISFVQRVAISLSGCTETQKRDPTYHSKSLYMIVKKTCKKRLTAFISTARRYSHASPDIMCGYMYCSISVCRVLACVVLGEVGGL